MIGNIIRLIYAAIILTSFAVGIGLFYFAVFYLLIYGLQ